MDLAELKARIEAVHAEISDLRREFLERCDDLQGLSQSDCQQIVGGIERMRDEIKEIETDPFYQSAYNQIFCYQEAESLFNVINDVISSENLLAQCFNANMATIKQESSFKISPAMIQAVRISFYYEHASRGDNYFKVYSLDAGTYIQWNQFEMEALLDLYLDWHTEDEEVISECVVKLLDNLSRKVCSSLARKYYSDEILDIPEWIRLTGQDRKFTVTISDVLLSH